MNRRDVLKSGLAASVAGATNVPIAGAESNHFYELRIYELRNDIQPARIQEFFQNHFMPMLKRQGVGPVGCFNVISGLRSPPRVFVLRTYESRSGFSLRNKLEMFNQEEIKIFRDCGFAPVFFGEAIAGERLPHLTYLIGFDNMAAREKAWDTFRANPDWARVRNKPGWTDPEAVSNIHAAFLRPTAYSQIR